MLKISGLTPEILHVVRDKGTEPPGSGEYTDLNTPGTYLCRQCGLALFRSAQQFHAHCGWAAFDDEIIGTIARVPDADGQRIEITCSRCFAHLGHEFRGEHYTEKNLRHCVNSLSLDFVKNLDVTDSEEAIFAGGCFWGLEYYFSKMEGVLKTEVGYTGGEVANPVYEVICAGHTGHFEALRIIYDPKKIHYETLAHAFFNLHDPTQTDGQGPDRGSQYLSGIFYYDETQKKTAEYLIQLLKDNKYAVVTYLLPAAPFWKAESYHQQYYEKQQKQPYCHRFIERF